MSMNKLESLKIGFRNLFVAHSMSMQLCKLLKALASKLFRTHHFDDVIEQIAVYFTSNTGTVLSATTF